MQLCTKRPYRTKKEARTAVRNAKSSRGQYMRAYNCPHCEYHHLTTQEPNWKVMRDMTAEPKQ